MKRSKYGNKKCTYKGIKFDSLIERDRYIFLKDAEDNGVIEDLKCQVPFELHVNNKLVCKYISDFTYYKRMNSEFVVEDVKGVVTAVFRLKKKLMLAVHGIDVRIVKSPTEEI